MEAVDNQKALIKAIEKRNLEAIKELVDGGADLNEPFTPINTTPFQYAMVFFKDLKSVETLIKLGGNVNSTNDHLETPLMIAVNLDGPVKKCDPRLPALFVEYGVESLDAQNQWGNTALLNVLLDGNIKSRRDLVECFVRYGADIFKKRNRRGLSAWDVISDKSPYFLYLPTGFYWGFCLPVSLSLCLLVFYFPFHTLSRHFP